MVDPELILNLCASETTNTVESVVLGVNAIAEEFHWSIEERQRVGAFVCEQRELAVKATIESLLFLIKEVAGRR